MALTVPIVADTSGLVRGLGKGQSSLKRFGKIAAIAAGAAAFGGLVKTLEVGVKGLMDQQKATAQTEAVLKSTANTARTTTKAIEELSGSLEMKTGIDAEQVQAGANLLATFSRVRNEVGKGNDIFNQATRAALDMSVTFGTTTSGAAIQLGKALQDPIRGVTALRRTGISFTKSQIDTIKSLVESNRILDAQRLILGEVNKQVEGSAEAFGTTLEGQLQRARKAFDQVAEQLAVRLIPIFSRGVTAVTEFLSKFAQQPTLRAKIEFVLGGIRDAAGRAFSSIISWWTTTQVRDLPARVIITPAGKDQVAAFFRDLQGKMEGESNRLGQRIGASVARGLFSGFSTGMGRRQGDIIATIGGLYTGEWLIRIGREQAIGVWTGFTNEMRRLGKSWPDVFRAIINLYNPFEQGRNIGGALWEGFKGAVGRRGGVNLANRVTDAVRDAVNSARTSLAGAGAGILDSIMQIRRSSFTRAGGMSPAAMTAEAVAIEDKRLELEEKRLLEAANSVEATEEDKLAIREFYLNKETILRERELAKQENDTRKSIDSLIESFNQGTISAEKFATDLRGIIGADLGAELGGSFAASFGREIDQVIKIAQAIGAVTGATGSIPFVPGGAPEVGGALRSENERRFREDLEKWQKRRDARKRQAENARKTKESAGGATITEAERKEINAIMAAWDRDNKKPNRGAYGLALGGILKGPTFVAGEAGREAVIPLDSPSAMKMLRAAVGGGGGSATVINLTVNAGLGTNPDDLSRVIVESIKRYEKRNGQVFSGPLVTSTASAAGVTTTASGASDFNFIRASRRG